MVPDIDDMPDDESYVPYQVSIPHRFNPFAPRTAKTQWSFGHSECKRVKCWAFRCMGLLPDFAAIFTEGSNFHYFLFAAQEAGRVYF